ncbi:MAG: D-alanyl-D-alanine carboxypeptidase [Erysipelotrichaceae bacterium]
MKVWLCLLLCFSNLSLSKEADDMYCILSFEDQSILESKNAHLQKSVASTSKIMSAIIALEQGKLKDEIKVSPHILDAYGSSIYLKVNQKISLKSLLYGLLLRSGNDAAIEIAYHISGSEKNFVKEMNKKANEIGMLNTEFHNSSGIDDQGKGNLSTAYDMAVLMSYAMKNKNFRTITRTKYYQEGNRKWKNKNRLLFDFPFVNGGKCGYTKKAGRTLVTSAIKDDLTFIIVTLKKDDDFTFHKEKYQQLFKDYKCLNVLNKGTYQSNQYQIKINKDIKSVIRKDNQDQLSIHTHIEDNIFTLELNKNKQVQLYHFPAKRVQHSFFDRFKP